MPITVYKPKKGYTWNPLKKRKRNDPCICGSGKKFKKCCLDNIHEFIPKKLADEMKRQSNINSAIILYYYNYNKEVITDMIIKKQIKNDYVPESVWRDIKVRLAKLKEDYEKVSPLPEDNK